MAADEPIRSLHLRAPGAPLLLGELLGRACPGLADERLAEWARACAIRVDDRVVRDLDAVVEPAARVDVDVAEDALDERVWPGLRADAGHAFVLTPSPPWARGVVDWSDDDAGAGGIELLQSAERNGIAELELRWSIDASVSSESRAFHLARRVLARLAGCGLCVVGDPFHGAIAGSSGPAWRSGSVGSHADTGAWPEEPLFVEAPPGEARPVWPISDATARVLGRGHPWIRLDDETDDPASFRVGARVDLVTRDGRRHGQALVEGAGRCGGLALREGDVAGRLVARASPAKAWSVESSVARALERRADLIAGVVERPADPIAGVVERPADPIAGVGEHRAETDAFRLVHGEADGLPGLHVDRLGALVRVLVTARCALPLVDRALMALGAAGPSVLPDPWRVIEVVHLDERAPGRFECVRVHPYSADPDGAAELGREATVRERGLAFAVTPGLADPERSAPGFGLFLDQRENRAAFADHVRAMGGGGRFLNLFAHTGAFSVAWLAAGAGEVSSVDLSAAVLRRLEANLAANADAGVDAARHVSVCQDGRRYLERLDASQRFDGIVLDPPTAAAAGRRFFSVRKDVVAMLSLCLAHLAPGGRLLVTLNDRRARRRLEAAIDEAAAGAGVALRAVEPAPPSCDFPHLDGFAEGDPFGGFVVQAR